MIKFVNYSGYSKNNYLRIRVLLFLNLLILLYVAPVTAQSCWKSDILHYINNNLVKTDGGYGWEDQPDSHLTPTFAVAGILNDLGKLPENRSSLIEFIRTHHPQRGENKEAGPSGTEIRNLVYQQIQSIIWLGGDASHFQPEVNGWKSQARKLANYEKQGYPVLVQEVMTPICLKLLNLPLSGIKPDFLTYLDVRQRENGSYNNAPVKDGGDGNILNTYWSLYAMDLLGNKSQSGSEAIYWINACQLKNGGFTHQPDPEIGTNDEVAYTWAAIKALQLLSVKPKNTKSCIQYLLSLRNADGGFGNRPGLPSTPMSTYYAIDALKALNALSSLDGAPLIKRPQKEKTDFSGYKVFTVQFEASGSGSPSEAVMLADSLEINLWGAKNAGAGWIETAQEIAYENKVPVIFFQADEPYEKNVYVPGMGTFGHILDYIAPAGIGFVPFKTGTAGQEFRRSAIGLKDSSSWQEFREVAIQPLLKADGGLILQVSNNEPLARILLDESVANGGYLAISTIHFGQNFLFWLPYLDQYRYQLPFVALQDAHGTESWWWSNELVSYRTLFLAKEPGYKEMVTALKNNWVMAVRHDSISDYKTRMLGGTADARQFIISKQKTWQWWKEDSHEMNHPWAAITVVEPADTFEIACPVKGVNIRIRCWWDGVRNIIKEPLVKLHQLSIDNTIINPEFIKLEGRKGVDSYYLFSIPNPSEGEHVIEARLRYLKTNSMRTIIKRFNYKNQHEMQ